MHQFASLDSEQHNIKGCWYM